MKISARNQFSGQVIAIKSGVIHAEVILKVAEGVELVSILTQEGLERLGLSIGDEALAFIKAFHVMLMANDSDLIISARNQLLGKIITIQSARINAEVIVGLADELRLKAIVTQEGLEELGVREGDNVQVIFKASNVLLGRRKLSRA